MTQKIREKIKRKVAQGMPLTKEESYWIYSENRRMTRDLSNLLDAAQVALEGMLRFATNFTGTIVLARAVAKHRSIGRGITNGKTTRSASAKRVEPL